MNKPKAQGTAWETAFVQKCHDLALMADRLPEGGLWDAGDVWIGDLPGRKYKDIPILAWKRLVKTDSTRRVVDGAGVAIVMSFEDFGHLARLAVEDNIAFIVECKATEKLNVTRVLDQARRKLANWKNR